MTPIPESEIGEPIIRMVDVCKELGGRQVLDGVSLEVRRGETLVIIGRSGTGKSVSLKHMIGLMQPDGGIVEVFGKNLAHATQKELDALMSRERNHEKVILPIWLNVNEDEVASYSPMLLDRVAAKASNGLEHVVSELIQVLSNS